VKPCDNDNIYKDVLSQKVCLVNFAPSSLPSIPMTNFSITSWLPLLFIPTNASPLFVLSFLLLSYLLNRPCVYCSILLLILFTSSCHWSTHCFLEWNSNWFEPRHLSSTFPLPSSLSPSSSSSSTVASCSGGSGCQGGASESVAGFAMGMLNSTAAALAGAAYEEAKRRIPSFTSQGGGGGEWTGLGLEWVRSLLGRREWVVPCVEVAIRL
jgi:hypothetical protein